MQYRKGGRGLEWLTYDITQHCGELRSKKSISPTSYSDKLTYPINMLNEKIIVISTLLGIVFIE